jgi:acid phosphatase family membrane protein YuiD
MVEELVLAGADLTIGNSQGDTALAIAKKRGYTDIESALAIVKTVVVTADAAGLCRPMSIQLTYDQPNKVIFNTNKEMVMLDSKDLGISLMAMQGANATITLVPKNRGVFKMTCGKSTSGGNPTGSITVQ